MSLLCRIKPSRIHSLSSRIRQCVVSQALSITAQSSDSKARVFHIQDLGFRPRPTEFCSNVRFFAAPVQVKPKEEVKDSGKHRMNEKISAEYVRLVDEDGIMLLYRGVWHYTKHRHSSLIWLRLIEMLSHQFVKLWTIIERSTNNN